jgi:hypothetical protein
MASIKISAMVLGVAALGWLAINQIDHDPRDKKRQF